MSETVTLDDKFTRTDGTVMMTGIQALVRTTIDQRRSDERRGLNTAVLVSGYQGSPLGTLDKAFGGAAKHVDPLNIKFRQGLNEELGATAVAGTQLIGELEQRQVDGVTGIWYGKNPGLDRAADAIRHGNISGTTPTGGAVAWIGDDPTAKSSTVPSSCEPMCRSLFMPLLAPGTVEQALSFGRHAIEMSRHSGLWTGLKIVADVADATATVSLDGLTDQIPEFPRRPQGAAPVMLPPTNLDAEHDAMTVRLHRAMEYGRAAGLNRVTHEPSEARVVVVASGMAYQSVLRALSDHGLGDADLDRLGVRLVELGMPYPLDPDIVREFAEGVEKIIVVEDKLAFLEGLIKEPLYRTPNPPEVVGKRTENGAPLFTARAALTSDEIGTGLRREVPGFKEIGTAPTPAERSRPQLDLLPSRTPAFCSGCPHSVSTRADEDQLVGVGIGCHIMVALEGGDKRGKLVGMTQMGGEGAQWLGLEPFTGDDHFFQNLGDGTFYHSGSLALRAAVAADANVTYKLLFNDAVAMTGGQNPEGQMDVPALTRWLALEGVRKIVVTTANPKAWRRVKLDKIATVTHRDNLQDAQRELAKESGVTVLLHIDRCATEERRMRKRGKSPAPAERIWINERVCEGCGDCGDKSTCLSVLPVETEYGRKTQIHQSSCNQDFSCVKGDCPSFVRVTPGGATRQPKPLPSATLSEPVRRVGDDVLVRMPGVGGTGVVTVSQVLQMAAFLDGHHAAGLEQIGLAQKGGPVISDLRFSSQPVQGQLRAGKGTVDVMLGLDGLGAAGDSILESLRSDAAAVLNSARVPTARMVQDIAIAHPAWQELEDRIAQAVGTTFAVDAQGLADRYFADHMPTNMIIVGAAYQQGLLPISEDAIERAIRLNGAAVQLNLDAFRLGRIAVDQPELLNPDVTTADPAPTTWTDAVEKHAAELVGYQNDAYADSYRVRVLEMADVVGADAEDVLMAYANGLFKLMAYKDEYEVARLHLDSIEQAKLAEEFGEDAKVQILLHPPILRAMGMKNKLALGAWIRPFLRLLYAMRIIRGGKLDIFGYAKVRRVERELPGEYTELVRTLASRRADRSVLLEACELPDVVRGYEDIKLANVEQFRARRAELLADDARVAEPVA